MANRQRQVVWAAAALAAPHEATEYLAEHSQPAAVRLADTALSVAAGLASFATRGRIVPELCDDSIREAFVFRYRLMYRVEADRVTIVGFVHGARDFARWRRNPSD